jgi:hypothetical protein
MLIATKSAGNARLVFINPDVLDGAPPGDERDREKTGVAGGCRPTKLLFGNSDVIRMSERD